MKKFYTLEEKPMIRFGNVSLTSLGDKESIGLIVADAIRNGLLVDDLCLGCGKRYIV
jgi:hypothetical protein